MCPLFFYSGNFQWQYLNPIIQKDDRGTLETRIRVDWSSEMLDNKTDMAERFFYKMCVHEEEKQGLLSVFLYFKSVFSLLIIKIME